MLKKKLEPWEAYPKIWKNKAAFFVYLRGHLRLLWSRYPAKIEWKKSKLVKPPPSYTGRAKMLGQCAYCNEWFAASHLEVDHIEQAGTCNSWDTSYSFLYKLLECSDNWCLSCKPCHKIKSYAEKQGISYEEAAIQKEVIEICKSKQKTVDLCQEHGYNVSMLKNAKQRREAVETIIRKERKK